MGLIDWAVQILVNVPELRPGPGSDLVKCANKITKEEVLHGMENRYLHNLNVCKSLTPQKPLVPRLNKIWSRHPREISVSEARPMIRQGTETQGREK